MDNLKSWGVHYISNRAIHPLDAVMFDIDDTLIFTNGNPNTPMIELLYQARKMGYKIVIITARPGIGRVIRWTTEQLRDYRIPYDYLGFTSADTKGLMKNHLPYNFVLSVGDLPTDLTNSEHALNISNFYHN
jgi:predicted HAD superfamily phosphohydrolase YqeG